MDIVTPSENTMCAWSHTHAANGCPLSRARRAQWRAAASRAGRINRRTGSAHFLLLITAHTAHRRTGNAPHRALAPSDARRTSAWRLCTRRPHKWHRRPAGCIICNRENEGHRELTFDWGFKDLLRGLSRFDKTSPKPQIFQFYAINCAWWEWDHMIAKFAWHLMANCMIPGILTNVFWKSFVLFYHVWNLIGWFL